MEATSEDATFIPLNLNELEDDSNNSILFLEEDPVYFYNYTKAARMINLVSRPICLTLGTLGNTLAFLVMIRGSLRKVSTCFYMMILTLADTGVLWSGAFVWWVAFLTQWKINPEVWGDCKLDYFLFNFCRMYSSALVVIMSAEKFFALYFPLKTRSICTVKTAKRISLVTAILLAGFNVQHLFMYKADKMHGFDVCIFLLPDYEILFYRIIYTLYSFAPFTIIFFLNSAIIYKFVKAKWESRYENSESTSQALSKSAMKGTAMLITVSVAFLVLTAPVTVSLIIDLYPQSIIFAIVINLAYVNHSINGVLYCIVGSRFRNELKNMLLCRKEKVARTHTMYVSTLSVSGSTLNDSTVN